MTIEIENKTFKTKKELKEYIRNIMNKLIEETTDENPYYHIKKKEDETLYNFLKALAYYNKEKKNIIEERKIKYFGVQRNPQNNKTFHNYIMFKDKTDIDISFLWCVDLIGREKPNTDKTDLNQCLRKSINYQIKEFKNKTKDKTCKLCNKNNCEYHVDHIIKFRDLTKQFLSVNNEIPKIINDNINGGKMFENENNEFIKKWTEYHKKEATLRILCKDCNLKLH